MPALVAAGVATGDPRIRRAVRWLEDHQNADGGWGEDVRSYDRCRLDRPRRRAPPRRRRGRCSRCTPPASARARSRRGVDFLVRTQREDGGWDEPEYTGTGFPSDFYINYHLYRLVFPIMALGRLSR